jgi:hypothetical protein
VLAFAVRADEVPKSWIDPDTGHRVVRLTEEPGGETGQYVQARTQLEPNVSFSPDEKWLVFRSNMLGPTYAFAVEAAKAQ